MSPDLTLARELERLAAKEPDTNKAGLFTASAHAIRRLFADVARTRGLTDAQTSVLEGVELSKGTNE